MSGKPDRKREPARCGTCRWWFCGACTFVTFWGLKVSLDASSEACRFWQELRVGQTGTCIRANNGVC